MTPDITVLVAASRSDHPRNCDVADYYRYKGYVGSTEVHIEATTFFGRLLFIQDVTGYSATSPAELKQAFEVADDEYLKTCETLGERRSRRARSFQSSRRSGVRRHAHYSR